MLERVRFEGEHTAVELDEIELVGGLITQIVFTSESGPQLFDCEYCLMVYVPGVLKVKTTVLEPFQELKLGLDPPKVPVVTVKPVDGLITYLIFVVVEQL